MTIWEEFRARLSIIKNFDDKSHITELENALIKAIKGLEERIERLERKPSRIA